MGNPLNIGLPGLLIIAVLVLVLFGGRGKIPALMKDMGKGITAFRKGLKDDGDDAEKSALEDKADKPSDAATAEKVEKS